MNGTERKATLIAVAETFVREAAEAGAQVVVLPEKWNGFGSRDLVRSAAEDADAGESVAAMASWARTYGVCLIGGSITLRDRATGDLRNQTLVFDPRGTIVASYAKVHMFDADIDGVAYRESEFERAGTELVQGWTVGLAICYDLRFPEVFRAHALRGATLLVIPSAFTAATGRAHWEVLLRARAIENACYVVAPNQEGPHEGKRASHGHSMIITPWGEVLASLEAGPGVVMAELDNRQVERARAAIPALTHRRQNVYSVDAGYAAPQDGRSQPKLLAE
jgi:nitrilase